MKELNREELTQVFGGGTPASWLDDIKEHLKDKK